MIRLTQAIVAVMSCTLAAGAAGGIVGAAVGRLAPSFVRWLVLARGAAGMSTPPSSASAWASSAASSSASAPGVFLVCVLALRDAWLARAGHRLPHHAVRCRSRSSEGRRPELSRRSSASAARAG